MTILASVEILGRDFKGPCDIAFADGKIASITPAASPSKKRLLAMPGLANAHDHARPLSPTSFGGAGKPLESWLLRLGAMPAGDPYLCAAASLGRAAQSGCASVMAHVTRLQGPMAAPEEAAIVAKAAADIGVRTTFALFMRDRNPLVYGDSDAALGGLPADDRHEIEKVFCNPMAPLKAQMEMIDAVAEAAENPLFSVQYGPNGVQWCSDAMLEAIAEASERTGRRVHMHLLETPYQRFWADRAYPQGVVRRLKEIGLLSPRLALAHCVHATPEDLELIAEAGATIVTNASSNLHLRSGVAPISVAIRRGCRVAMGVDGSALDEDDDTIREMRLAHFLHGGWGFDSVIERQPFLDMVVANGRYANGAPGGGAIEVGEAGDVLVLDLDALDRDAITPVDPLDFVFARANQSHVVHTFVAGRQVVADGRLVGIDLDAAQNELRALYRSRMPQKAGFLRAWPKFEPGVAAFYRDTFGCC
ncbi:MAG: amidohydrolase [Hyphomicrobiales bacterium]|nr:amidohydrolase [Hyphomicrobiales bacterium]